MNGISWGAAWRIARRDLSGGFRGLRLLLVCLFLGVSALSAIGTLTGSIERELASRGREILGGDVEVRIWQRDLAPQEMAVLEPLGRVSTGYRLQAIAMKGDRSAPIALKAVDDAWPMVGRLVLKDGRTVGAPPPSWRPLAWATGLPIIRRSFPAASSSAWPSRGRPRRALR